MKITFEPFGNIADDTIETVRKRVGQIFGCPTEIGAGFDDLAAAYYPDRNQYLSSKLLALLRKPQGNERVAGIAEVDLFVPGLNYVFGEASPSSGKAIVSLCRLRQEHYGLAPDEAVFYDRAVKEIVHELGHTFGLVHCPNNRCVMHFSNSLADTDLKEAQFCTRCRPKIIL